MESWVFHRFRKNDECDIKISLNNNMINDARRPYNRKGTDESKPREDQVEKLIQHLHMDPELPEERVCRPIDVMKVDRGMNSSEEGSIQPATPLGYEFGDLKGKSARS
jgi:hypothetical protein